MFSNYLPKRLYNYYFSIDFVKNSKIVSALNIFLIFAVFINNSANSQIDNYSFTESSGSYITLTSTTIAIASTWNDIVIANTIPIEFSFGFNVSNYTTCSMNSD